MIPLPGPGLLSMPPFYFHVFLNHLSFAQGPPLDTTIKDFVGNTLYFSSGVVYLEVLSLCLLPLC